MSNGETTPPPSPAEVVTADIAKYPGLVSGAAEALGGLWGALGSLPADKRAEEIARRIDGPLVARYRDPEYKGTALANGQPPSQLRQALERQAGRLAPGAIDALTAQLAGQVVGKSPPQIAGEVERFLGSRAAQSHLAVRPEQPAHERRLDDIVRRHFSGEVDPSQMAALYRDPRVRTMGERLVVAMIARTIGLPASDSRSGGGPSSIEHRQPAPATPSRAADGTFQAEATPPRRSLVK